MSGKKRIEPPERRDVESQTRILKIWNASVHNLKNLSVEVPLSRFVCITGVSGSGKTTLVRDVLIPALDSKLKMQKPEIRNQDPEEAGQDESADRTFHSALKISGWETLGRVLLVDQSPLGKTPRSNPAVYIGAFDDVRELFAQTEAAKQRGLNASAFSFNSAQGQCEKCRGAGFEKIEMQFLSDVFIRCSECNGRRYRPHILEIKLKSAAGLRSPASWSIADLLEATVDEAVVLLASFSESRHAQRAVEKLKLLQEVGLGYLRLGQPINTLSGGESQRLKLVSHLAESPIANHPSPENSSASESGKTLFLFDEPTTGLHFEDVRVLLSVFHRIVDAGHSVVVIEHNLDVIRSADWVIDLGPNGGEAGGEIVVSGTPEKIAACPESHTGRALRPHRL